MEEKAFNKIPSSAFQLSKEEIWLVECYRKNPEIGDIVKEIIDEKNRLEGPME